MLFGRLVRSKAKLGARGPRGLSKCLLGSACALGMAAIIAGETLASAAAADNNPASGGTIVAAIDPGTIASLNTQLTSLTA